MTHDDTRAEPSLTHRDMADALGVTVTTIKSYRRKFPEFFAGALEAKPIRFPAHAQDVCARIHQLFGLGLGVEQVRERLALEFSASPAGVAPPRRAPQASSQADSLARIETLLEGLFGLQNRTHSLLAELVAKLDTVADALAAGQPPRTSAASPSRVTTTRPLRPMQELLDLPVVVRSNDGEFLGVTSKGGKPFSLAQFEVFLLKRAQSMGEVRAKWRQEGEQQWVLSLESKQQAHDHHFKRSVTPKGNAVARFVSLSVGGRAVSDAALQAFLRQVKESLDQ